MMTVPMDSSSAPSSQELAQRLFKKNIELENGLRKSAQAKIPSDPNVWLQMRENYEAIILEDHEFSEKHEVEFMLWQLHYRRIEEFRLHINAAKSTGLTATQGGRSPARPDRIKKIRSAFKSFLSESTGFYHDLIIKIQAKYGLPLGYFYEGPESQNTLSKDEKKSADMKKGQLSSHRCLIYLGDLARYKGMYGEGDSVVREFAAASSYYMQAASLCPSSGNPHHQLAILASYSNDDFVTTYRYFRSLAVDNPFSTARDNLIIAFEKNRQRVAQLPGAKTATSNVLPPRSAGRGRGRGDARTFAKDNNLESQIKEQDLSTAEIFKAFSARFVRLHGILFTRTSLETFGDVFSSVISDLHELLADGIEEAFNFGVDAAESGLVIVRLVSILIFTVHNVNRDAGDQSYAEILQRSVLLQNAFTASFQFVGHMLKRCVELHDVSSSFLLPGIMVFMEWLACHPDIAAGFDVKEKQATARTFFWDQCVVFMNALLSSGHGYVDTYEDDTCFSEMSRYDEGETGNRLALWEDFELRGFLPLVQAHLILDFSRKQSIGGDGTIKERRARVQRIFAAGSVLMNVVRIDQRVVYFDRLLKKFVFGVEPPAFVDDVYAGIVDAPYPNASRHASSVESVSNLGGSQSSMMDLGLAPVNALLHADGEDDEEEIVFKPTAIEKLSSIVASMPAYETVQPAHVSVGDWDSTAMQHSFLNNDTQLSNDLNPSSKLRTSIPAISPQPSLDLDINTSKWLLEKEAMLSEGLKNMNFGNGLMFQGGLNTFKPSVCTSSLFSNQVNVTDTIIPSPLDSIVPPGAMTTDLHARTSAALPAPTVSKKNPVSRPVRHFGPPPGFNHASSKPQPGTIHNLATNDQQLPIDDYSWLDDYQPSTKGLMETSVSHASVMHPYPSGDNSSTFGGVTSFPFPGKQTPPLQNDVTNEKFWQDFQLFEHLKPFAEQHLPHTNLRPAMLSKQHQTQSMWSGGYLV
ncbi:protein SMG7 [Phalaenopsis equestris]|uniref:protein SMG7 n=1 Tax=Phalaenopsis equestris TaxID=78828 RepID=UPI0009E44AC9|nr:protein SMG7 [Phalaenopsis equestris]